MPGRHPENWLDRSPRARIVCLCGSTRFPGAFHLANLDETIRGHIVISVGLFGHADQPTGATFLTEDGDEATEIKQQLDALHKEKINLADEILVINVGEYIGSSTRSEIDYAIAKGKPVRYLMGEDRRGNE